MLFRSFIPGLLFQVRFLGKLHSIQVLLLDSLSERCPYLQGFPVKYLVKFCLNDSCNEIVFIYLLMQKRPDFSGLFCYYLDLLKHLVYRRCYEHRAIRSRNAQLPCNALSQSQSRLP